MSLLQQLLKKGLIDKEKAASLEYEIRTSGRKEEEMLLGADLIPEQVLFELKSQNLKIPLKKVIPSEISLKILEIIPSDTAKYYKIIALSQKENLMEIGMVYPEDLSAQEALKFLSRQQKFNYNISLISLTDFKNLLKQYQTLKGEVSRALEKLDTGITKKTGSQAGTKAKVKFERLVEDAPISKVVAVILRHAVEGQASDVHIEPTREKLRIRFRVLGNLYSSIFLPLKVHPAIVARVKILSNIKIDETRIPQDGRFTTKIDEKLIDFRVSTFPTTLGEKVAIRVLDPTVGLKTFKELGLTERNINIIKKALSRPYGLILSTGPTGSGKTTTLYALLQVFNKEGVNIVTLEDPVEYFIPGVNQSQIKPEIDYDFARGLRHILRQDPDIIMVGEVRDEESASLVVHAALTGHIVLSTLHTSNVLGVVPRLIDMGVKNYLIPPILNCALSQRLVRQLCEDCKQEIKPKKEIKDLIIKEFKEFPLEIKKEYEKKFGPNLKNLSVCQPKGCKKCDKLGFSGRFGLFEVLLNTSRLSEIILKQPTEKEIFSEAKQQKMLTMRQDGILKVLDGTTTIEEVLRVSEEK